MEDGKVTTLLVEYNMVQLCWRKVQCNLEKLRMDGPMVYA